MATKRKRSARGGSRPAPVKLRIIGGRFRGRRLAMPPHPATRPMKDRTREAIFDLLGPAVVDKVAIDLFAGSGAMGLEAISRGAKRAVFVEQHVAARRTIEQNVSALGVEDVAAVVAADVFAWAARRDLPADGPWLVSCCPPYEFYTKRRNEMLQLIRRLVSAAPNDSVVVVEADRHFDVSDLPDSQQWDVRHYRPAVICIWRGILMTAS